MHRRVVECTVGKYFSLLFLHFINIYYFFDVRKVVIRYVHQNLYANYFKLDMSDIENGNITVNSNFYSETVIHKNEDKTDAVSDSIFDGTKENKATLHAISEDELKAIGIDMDNLSASVPE